MTARNEQQKYSRTSFAGIVALPVIVCIIGDILLGIFLLCCYCLDLGSRGFRWCQKEWRQRHWYGTRRKQAVVVEAKEDGCSQTQIASEPGVSSGSGSSMETKQELCWGKEWKTHMLVPDYRSVRSVFCVTLLACSMPLSKCLSASGPSETTKAGQSRSCLRPSHCSSLAQSTACGVSAYPFNIWASCSPIGSNVSRYTSKSESYGTAILQMKKRRFLKDTAMSFTLRIIPAIRW